MAPPPLAMSGDLQPLPLVRAQLLLAGLLNALNYGATTLIWPVSCDGEFEKIAKAQEQLLLAQHLAEMEQNPCRRCRCRCWSFRIGRCWRWASA
ncbi:MAG: hypothetical protein HC898_05610 [Phycisphaerales bacterium]|nr:hypothetical protein [Phycisphaerales bacterium]